MCGLFITFEGGEGSGKTTQIQHLKNWIESNMDSANLCLTREPGGTIEAESIRELLLNGAANKWQPATEAMMMSASRHEHVIHVIKPALSRGDIVICDRFTDSTHVYQGYVGGVDNALLDGLDQLSCQGLVPDLTFLLDMDSNAGLARTIQRGNAESRFESKGAAFHENVRQGFVERAEKYPDRIAKIDAARPADAVTKDVIAAVRALLVAKGMIAAS
ncbi:dTMP kinase [Alphaproteobacteria bacterium]|jgi:dTMP kinase|nr:dTMP kinase [Alphaproteobacteria bacterium]MDC1037071.1 dTMP kinase [Alphaproteobacteria bacterium]